MAAGVLGNTATVHSSDKKTNPAPTEQPKKARALPFRGKLDALDTERRTLTVGKRTFHLTKTTKITKAAKPASIEDAVKGEEVAGSYRKSESGKLELSSLRLGPKPTKKPKTTPTPEKAK
jgi:hypothetical protein